MAEIEVLFVPPRLTTLDNDWNPFTHFSEWFNEDTMNGYNTSAVYANAMNAKLKELGLELSELSDSQYCTIADEVISDLIRDFPLLYKKVESPKEVTI